MKKLPTRNAFYRAIWTADAFVSSTVYDGWRAIRSASSAYSAFLHRWFRISGVTRIFIDLVDDFFTFGVAIAFALLAYALPPFSGTGDIWNRGRTYAITFTDSTGNVIGRRGIRQDDAIPFNEIPPVLTKAVLATEDARFYDHFGVDLVGTLRAIVRNAKASGVKQGGSSITQQVAKNLFLSPERTIRRKVNEAFLALWIESRLSKQEILKLYLDRSYLGGGNYGVEAASQFYFGKSVRDIGLPEAAVLAGLFKAPTQYAPHANPEASRARSNVVLYRMLASGMITQGDLLEAKRHPATIVEQSTVASPNWFLDWAYQDTLDVMEKQGLKNDYVVEVKTTINSKLEAASQAIINDVIDTIGPDSNFSQAASITMAPDGAVRAIIGGRDYDDSQFNRVTQGKRQTGSAFKPFVYLTALMNGKTPDSIVVDGPVCVGDWCVHNFEPGFRGAIPLRVALTHSINTIAVKLMVEVGRKNVEAMAHLVGIQGKLDPYPTMAIGTSALTLMDLATGYATIAADGKLAKPYAVLEIRRPNGDLLYSHAANEAERPQVVPAEKMTELITMMRSVVTSGTGRAADLGFEPVAGKTGTNANFRDAWFMGFSAHHVTGVWVGNDDNSPMASSRAAAVTGGRVPAPAWKRIMEVAEAGLQPEGLPGVPLDASYSAVAAPPPDPALDSVEVPVAVDASGQPGVDPVDAGAREVLNGMADLFQSPEQDPAALALAAKASKKLEPAKPARRSLFDILFGTKPKPAKPKTLFGN
ncbi:MAG: PBP1A family penicillin-binding protein [Aestuariivirga sp.]